MVIRPLQEREINQVLGQNYKLWSPGLSPARYLHYQWWQLLHPWGRRHLKYWGYFNDAGELLASAKLYNFRQAYRGGTLRAAGIGAVFVPENRRGEKSGQILLAELIEHCKKEEFDIMLLNSDIDPAYYQRFGFLLFEPSVFRIIPDPQWLRYAIKRMDALCDPELNESFRVRRASIKDVHEIARHHARWLVNQEHGMLRSDDYMEFKLGKELYLAEHSSLGWPRMDIITDNEGQHIGGYALVEQAGLFLRVLEIIGPESIRNSLWGQILRLAQKREIGMIRGWAKSAPPLRGVEYDHRDWSLPMILSLRPELNEKCLEWTKLKPPCMLELDHF